MEQKTIQFDCAWPGNDALMLNYHHLEWGKPEHVDRKLFEMLVLESFQAGLSWKTILHKRENFRLAFDDFDPHKISLYDDYKVGQLLENKGIIRNRLKIAAAINNAQAFVNIVDEYQTFDAFIWQFSNYQTIDEQYLFEREVPCWSAESKAMSKVLISKGFKFVGPVICYSYMQAIGMINDHLKHCRHR